LRPVSWGRAMAKSWWTWSSRAASRCLGPVASSTRRSFLTSSRMAILRAGRAMPDSGRVSVLDIVPSWREASGCCARRGWGPAARARMAGVRGIDEEADFAEGHELDRETAERIPPKMVGRMLTPAEGLNLIRRLERTEPTPKRPPAPSIRVRPAKALGTARMGRVGGVSSSAARRGATELKSCSMMMASRLTPDGPATCWDFGGLLRAVTPDPSLAVRRAQHSGSHLLRLSTVGSDSRPDGVLV
jgi:hypothetical protein